MRLLSMLGAAGNSYNGGGIFYGVLNDANGWFQKSTSNKWLGDIVAFLGNILIPVTIILLAAGVVWTVYLGIQLARADDAGKAGEIKKRLINIAVAFIVTLAAVWIISALMAYIPQWLGRNDVNNTEQTTTMIETAIRSFLPKL